jgi:hypothetical protein
VRRARSSQVSARALRVFGAVPTRRGERERSGETSGQTEEGAIEAPRKSRELRGAFSRAFARSAAVLQRWV